MRPSPTGEICAFCAILSPPSVSGHPSANPYACGLVVALLSLLVLVVAEEVMVEQDNRVEKIWELLLRLIGDSDNSEEDPIWSCLGCQSSMLSSKSMISALAIGAGKRSRVDFSCIEEGPTLGV